VKVFALVCCVSQSDADLLFFVTSSWFFAAVSRMETAEDVPEIVTILPAYLAVYSNMKIC